MENWLRKKSEAEIAEQKKSVHLYKDLREESPEDDVALLRKVRAEKVTLPELEERVHEKVNLVVERLVATSPVVGTGYDGIVFRVNPSELSETEKHLLEDDGAAFSGQDSALKILKIYNSIAGESEFSIQKEAYERLQNDPDSAKIPEPFFLRDQKINEETKHFLNRKGANLSTNVEAIAMDFIEGKDLSTVFFDFVLNLSGYEEDYIDAMTAPQKYSEVANLLGFLMPTSDGREENIARQNEGKLVGFLKKNGFKLEPQIISKLERAMRILKENNIFHNDLHGRNVRLGSDGEVYIIDFGRASRENATAENSSFLNKWKSLVESIVEEKKDESLQIENLRLKIRETQNGQSKVSNLIKSIEVGRLSAAIRAVSADSLQTDINLACLKEIYLQNENARDTIISSLIELSESNYPYLSNKINGLLKSGYFS